MSSYEPTQEDMDWLCNLIEILKEGGVWGVPCSGGIFRFYKNPKEYVYDGNRDETDQKTLIILAKLGWKERKA